jgi:hypothetical protein
MDGLVASVTSGCVLGAAAVIIRALNAAPERNQMTLIKKKTRQKKNNSQPII